MSLFSINVPIVVPNEGVDTFKQSVTKALNEFNFKTNFTDKEVKFTEVTINVELETKSCVKAMLEKMGVPKEDITKLSNIKSFVNNSLYGLINSVLARITRA